MRLLQTNFTAGEISPKLEGRIDFAKYINACKTMQNWIPLPHGPAIVRPGFKYIAEVKDSSKSTRLVRFEFSVTQAYILEFGHLYMRVYKDGAQVLSGGNPYEIVTPYDESDLFELKFAQSADILYIAHPSYEPRKLSRTGHTSWTLSTINFRPPPTAEVAIEPAATLTPGATTGTEITFTAGSAVFQNGDVYREIISGTARAVITSYVSSTSVICDIIDDFSSTDAIASGSWEMRGSPYGSLTPNRAYPVGGPVTLVCAPGEISVALNDGSSDWWAASSSGTADYYLKNTASPYSSDKPEKVTQYGTDIIETDPLPADLANGRWGWGDNDTLGYDTIYIDVEAANWGFSTDDPDSGAANILKRVDTDTGGDVFRSTDVGKYVRINNGVILITEYISATQVKGQILKTLDSASASTSWTLEEAVWDSTKGYPAAVVFHEDRLCFAGSTDYPTTFWASQAGDYENFGAGSSDSDALSFTLNAREVNNIRWLESKKSIVIGTVGGVWTIGSETSSDPLTPSNVTAKPQLTDGCADIQPIVIGEAVIFVQRLGEKLREFVYQFESDGYVAPDLTLLAEHITNGGITDMDYQQEPYSVLWFVRNDGVLLGMSYLREQDVVGWHRHIIGGSFGSGDAVVESVACIPGSGNYNELWIVVKRTIDGATVRYVELMTQYFDAATTDDAIFLDSAYTYDSTATTTISGLDHLEGETVSILADGAAHADKTVSSGQITLDVSASTVQVGLSYTPDIETLRPEIPLKNGTAQGEIKRINDVVLRLYRTIPSTLKIGPDSSNLEQIPYRDPEMAMDSPPPLYSGDTDKIPYPGEWETDGNILIRQTKPLPATLVALIQEVKV